MEKRHTVLVMDNLAEEGVRILEEEPGLEVIRGDHLDDTDRGQALAQAEGLILRSGTKVTAEFLAGASRLRYVARAGVGVDNIDLTAASRRGIVVMNTPGGNTTSTAEHTWAMILALSRNLPQAHAALRQGKWERKKFIGTQLAGKTLGVIGLGRVGREVAKRAVAFGMRVVGYDPYFDPQSLGDAEVTLVERLCDLLSESDFITVHTPLTDDTRGMIGEREFALVRPGARVVNCARGGIVDEDALHQALTSGKVAGAALDVYTKEPPVDNPLLQLPNVVATPHLGASTEEAQIAVACEAARLMRQALLHGHVEHAVNLPALAPSEEPVVAPYLVLAEALGSFAAQLARGRIRALRVTYSGEAALRATRRITRHVTMGVLRPVVEEQVNVVNASVLATERGVRIEELKSTETGEFSTLVTLRLTTDEQERTVRGTLFGKNEPRLVEVDGFEVDAIPKGELLVVFDRDRPGLIGEIGRILGSHGINIARMTFGRKTAGGEAITVLNLDRVPPQEVLRAVEQMEDVSQVRHVTLPGG